MASSLTFLPFSFLLLSLISLSHAQNSVRPRALLLPVTKDATTLQYLTHIKQRTPLVPVKLTVDLGGNSLWVDCDSNYVSSSYRSARCGSAQCSLARISGCGECFAAPKPGCNKNTCSLSPYNPIGHISTSGELTQDVITMQSTDGTNSGPLVTLPGFLFACGSPTILERLASGVTGMAGLGRDRIGMPSQFAAAFSFQRKFALCLSSSTISSGAIFFGDGPYVMLPNIDVSKNLIYTPLLINPVSTAGTYSQGEKSVEYFIGVKSIKINEKRLSLNTTLLSINNKGVGGTKISTVRPYTVLETSIYNAVTQAFTKEAVSMGIKRVESVAPFGACFSSNSIVSTRVGPSVPLMDLVLQRESVYWRIFGVNSMVKVSDGVSCLGFVDGGLNPETSIVIGGYQLENNLLQFDIATSRLGFSSSLLFQRTSCANFNFTSTVS
ncbi:hypothetical protein HHK36_020657 [Tetracentron sinense]|uniref:Peptidase A1 domain-containing protein n=1 Tax=Tetracentron sinense TaxID=13715 RepID=A0A834YS04_TETSI|nr:hypothetical protein HHK36_020657 [Tetracentron sinense]